MDKMKEPVALAREEAAKAAAAAPRGEGRQAGGQAELKGGGEKGHTKAEADPPPKEAGEPQTAGPSPERKRAIVVTTPKEEAEMVDLVAGPKKRGRPRKSPAMDPPDPHKGSVLYPEKGVCADPVDKGAILGEGGKLPSSDKGRQFATDIAGEKT
jgi:hypothetical protein